MFKVLGVAVESEVFDNEGYFAIGTSLRFLDDILSQHHVMSAPLIEFENAVDCYSKASRHDQNEVKIERSDTIVTCGSQF